MGGDYKYTAFANGGIACITQDQLPIKKGWLHGVAYDI